MDPKKLDRRQFLRLSALVAAAGVVTACGPETIVSTPTASTAATSAVAPTPAGPTATTAPISVSTGQGTPAPTKPAAGPASPAAAGGGSPTAAPAAASYKEAPQLAELVKSGKLPPVAQRLPASPRVLTPLEQVGQYGGTWHRAYTGLSDRVGPTKLQEQEVVKWDAPDPNTIRLVANIAEKWEQNDNATEFTFHLRKGLKWSDGTEVTTDDVKFWYEDIELNKDIRPVPSYQVQQKIGGQYKNGTLAVVDKYTFTMTYAAPFPLLPIQIAKLGGTGVGQPSFLAPSAYLKQFHPKYASQDALAKAMADKKVATWQDLWGKAGNLEGPIPFWFINPDLPVVFPWKIRNPVPAEPVVMERNPYFWQVDTAGNQLPYIDTIEHALYQQQDVFNLWIASGKIDEQGRGTSVGSYTFYKENEAKGNYRTFRWRAASTDAYFPNINCPDQTLAKLFDTPDFRQALSIAIDRKSINDLVWNGLGKPRQASPISGSPEYDSGLEQMWAEYDPAKANALLDGIGLKKGADGIRLRPDNGQPLAVTIEHTSIAGSPDDDAHQQVKKYWEAIGVKTNVQYVERSLYEEHVHNAQVQIGYWGFDRCSVVKADPGRWTGEIDDGPWAPAFGHWYDQNAYKKIEPPADHPIRQIWKLWEQTQQEPDEAKRNATFQQVLGVHKQHPWAIGVVGEKVSPFIVSNTFHNFLDGFISDDTLRDDGLLNPAQFFIKK